MQRLQVKFAASCLVGCGLTGMGLIVGWGFCLNRTANSWSPNKAASGNPLTQSAASEGGGQQLGRWSTSTTGEVLEVNKNHLSVRRGGEGGGTLVGKVLGPTGPVEGATVRWRGQAESVSTNGDGFFHLPKSHGGGRVCVSATGYFLASRLPSAGPLEIQLKPLPLFDNVHYEWVDPSPDSTSRHRCGRCHQRIFSEWRQSRHATSGSNPRFLDLVGLGCDEGSDGQGLSIQGDYPGGEDVCYSCHMPTRELADAGSDNPGGTDPAVLNGVHCDFCHKVSAVELPIDGLTHGRHAMHLLRPAPPGQIQFGPHDDAVRSDNAVSTVFRKSDYCGVCHEGTLFGVRVYTTLSEWRQSPAGRQGKHCQSCHMSAARGVMTMAAGHDAVERPRDTLSDHSHPGAVSPRYHDSLWVRFVTERSSDGLRVTITIDGSSVGHCIPTGFVDKHLLLIVETLDEHGDPVRLIQGPRLPDYAGRSVAGLPGFLFGRVLFGLNGKPLAGFWQPIGGEVDTRIRPEKKSVSQLTFDPAAAKIHVRLLHRRFWERRRKERGWPDDTTVLIDCSFPADEAGRLLLPRNEGRAEDPRALSGAGAVRQGRNFVERRNGVF